MSDVGESHEAQYAVVRAVGGAAHVDQVGHHRRRRTVRQAVVDAVQRVEHPDLPAGLRQAKTQVDDRVRQPAANDQFAPADPVGERRAGFVMSV